MTQNEIQSIVLDALRQANLARRPDSQLPVTPDAVVFGAGSALDSLGLVALLIDIEDAFAVRGSEINLSDDRAMSRFHNPFRTVETLTAYIQAVCEERA